MEKLYVNDFFIIKIIFILIIFLNYIYFFQCILIKKKLKLNINLIHFLNFDNIYLQVHQIQE